GNGTVVPGDDEVERRRGASAIPGAWLDDEGGEHDDAGKGGQDDQGLPADRSRQAGPVRTVAQREHGELQQRQAEYCPQELMSRDARQGSGRTDQEPSDLGIPDPDIRLEPGDEYRDR